MNNVSGNIADVKLENRQRVGNGATIIAAAIQKDSRNVIKGIKGIKNIEYNIVITFDINEIGDICMERKLTAH